MQKGRDVPSDGVAEVPAEQGGHGSAGAQKDPGSIDGTRERDPLRLTRRLGRAAESVHGVTYYSPEINRFTDLGFRGWWHAYFAYRLAPLGPVDLPVATAVFYNFAPRMVGRAIPDVWGIMGPHEVLETKDELVAEALVRIFGDGAFRSEIAEAATMATEAMAGVDLGARPLAAAHAALDWPADPAQRLLHACTVWREYRGDSHNIALAAADIDGPSSHLLMMAAGRGNRSVIGKIRGWTEDEWDVAAAKLVDRGVLDTTGTFTEHGVAFRAEIEDATDRLSARPVETLGPERAERLSVIMSSLSEFLKASGEIAGAWPPPTVSGG